MNTPQNPASSANDHSLTTFEHALGVLLSAQLNAGMPHGALIDNLLTAAEAMALLYPCCTQHTGQEALRMGGRLVLSGQATATSQPTQH